MDNFMPAIFNNNLKLEVDKKLTYAENEGTTPSVFFTNSLIHDGKLIKGAHNFMPAIFNSNPPLEPTKEATQTGDGNVTPSAFFTNSVMLDVKSVERPYKCNICCRSYNSKLYLRDHMTIHSDMRAYECKVCNKRFRFGSNLSEHRTVHVRDNLFFKCTECNHAVRLRGNLKKHMRKHFRDKISLDEAWQKFLLNSSFGGTQKGAHLNGQGLPHLLNYTFPFNEKDGLAMAQNCMSQPSFTLSNPGELKFGDRPPFLDNTYHQGAKRYAETGFFSSFRQPVVPRYSVDDLVNAFTKKVEDCANLADSVDEFLNALSDLTVDAIDCPFCGKRFASFADCVAHIAKGPVGHEAPVDEENGGQSRFCEKCLRCFGNASALSNHTGYHEMVKDMVESGYLNVRSRIHAFSETQSQKILV